MRKPGITTIVDILSPELPVYIHTHDFPDHDAVASAYALYCLLKHYGIQSRISYSGELQSFSLRYIIDALNIPIHEFSVPEESKERGKMQLIAIDGLSTKLMQTSYAEHIVALIDHHAVLAENQQYLYTDVRTEYGACATIIWDYYQQVGISCDTNVATAMLLGIMMDTAFMSRSVTPRDLNAFNNLFFIGDWRFASRVLRNSLSFQDAAIFTTSIADCIVTNSFAFVPLKQEYTSEAIALVADFFLNFREFDFVLICAPIEQEYRLSVRSENDSYPCNIILQKAITGIGNGGGHMHMGGGSIPREQYPGDKELNQRFLAVLQEYSN